MSDLDWKPFIVNIEGPDYIEDFDTMREAAERANAINAELVETISRGGEFAPHLWAVPWRTTTYLAKFKERGMTVSTPDIQASEHNRSANGAIVPTDIQQMSARLDMAAKRASYYQTGDYELLRDASAALSALSSIADDERDPDPDAPEVPADEGTLRAAIDDLSSGLEHYEPHENAKRSVKSLRIVLNALAGRSAELQKERAERFATTVEDLEALPLGSVVRLAPEDAERVENEDGSWEQGAVAERRLDSAGKPAWFFVGRVLGYRSHQADLLPATVLWVGGAP